MDCDRQIQLASPSSSFMVSNFCERRRRIPHNNPTALTLGDASVVSAWDGKVIKTWSTTGSDCDAPILSRSDSWLCDHERDPAIRLRSAKSHGARSGND